MNDNTSKAFQVFCGSEPLNTLEPVDISTWLLDGHTWIEDCGHWSELTSEVAPEQYSTIIIKHVACLAYAIVSGDIKQALEKAALFMASLWEYEHCFAEPTCYPFLETKLARVVGYLRRHNY